MTALERAARALLDRAGYTEYGPVVPEALASELARAVLMAVREPGDAFMEALYPDPDLIVADRGRAAGMRSRRAGSMQIAYFIDAILNEKDATNLSEEA